MMSGLRAVSAASTSSFSAWLRPIPMGGCSPAPSAPQPTPWEVVRPIRPTQALPHARRCRDDEGQERVNLGRWDRAVRIVVGVVVLAAGWTGVVPGWWAVACKLIGLFPLVTNVLGWDPLYALFRFRTSH